MIEVLGKRHEGGGHEGGINGYGGLKKINH